MMPHQQSRAGCIGSWETPAHPDISFIPSVLGGDLVSGRGQRTQAPIMDLRRGKSQVALQQASMRFPLERGRPAEGISSFQKDVRDGLAREQAKRLRVRSPGHLCRHDRGGEANPGSTESDQKAGEPFELQQALPGLP